MEIVRMVKSIWILRLVTITSISIRQLIITIAKTIKHQRAIRRFDCKMCSSLITMASARVDIMAPIMMVKWMMLVNCCMELIILLSTTPKNLSA